MQSNGNEIEVQAERGGREKNGDKKETKQGREKEKEDMQPLVVDGSGSSRKRR